MVRLPDATDQIRLAPLRALRAVFSGVGQLLLAADRLREEDARQEQESGEDRRETPASWDGRLSSSVRLITPTGMPAQNSRDPAGTPGGKSERAGRKSERGRGSERGRSPGANSSAPGRRSSADSERADRADRADRTGTRKPGRSRNAAEPSRFRSLDLTGNVRMLTDQDITDLAPNQVTRSTADAHADESGQAKETTPSWSDAAPPWSSWATSTQQTPPFSPREPQHAELPISGYDELSLPSLRARLRNLGTAELRDLLAHEKSHANRADVVTMFERRIAKLAED